MNARPRARLFTHLWFAGKAEEAVRFYAGLFPESSLDAITTLPGDASDGTPPPVRIIDFTLLGQRLQALDAGPHHAFNDAISLVVECADQDEVDRYWNALLDGGEAMACGWLADRYGLRWQIVPAMLDAAMNDPDPAAVRRVCEAVMGMVKLDIAELERARRG